MNSTTNALASELAALLDTHNIFKRNGLTAYPWQTELLESTGDVLVLAARQSGKSAGVCSTALSTALVFDDATVILASASERQSRELLRTGKRLLIGGGYGAEITNDAVMSLELSNGSRLIAVSAAAVDSVRGFSDVRLLILDECAFVPGNEFFAAVAPVLAVSKRGRMICVSSAGPRDSWFARQWFDEKSRWKRIKTTALENPRISKEFLEQQERALGREFRSEYLCEFLTPGDAVFDVSTLRIEQVGVLELHV